MWGPRMVLFLPEDGFEPARAAVDLALRRGLPSSFCGYPTHFGAPDKEGIRHLATPEGGEIDHLVELWTLPDLLQQRNRLGHAHPARNCRLADLL